MMREGRQRPAAHLARPGGVGVGIGVGHGAGGPCKRGVSAHDIAASIVGLTRGSKAAHSARAAIEAIAFQSAALLQTMTRDAQPVSELCVDDRVSVKQAQMQFQAELLGIPVVRPESVETTALGAGVLAGLTSGVYSGVYSGLDELSAMWRIGQRFEPSLACAQSAELMARREHTVRQSIAA